MGEKVDIGELSRQLVIFLQNFLHLCDILSMQLLNTCFVPFTLQRALHTYYSGLSKLYELVLSSPIWHLGSWESENWHNLSQNQAWDSIPGLSGSQTVFFPLCQTDQSPMFFLLWQRSMTEQCFFSSQFFVKDQRLLAIPWRWNFRATSLSLSYTIQYFSF